MVDLSDFVESLRREVTPPGSDLFTDVDDTVMTGYLADAFWEARLDGFLGVWVANEDGLVTPMETGGDDLPRELIGLVILYAGVKILRNRLMNLNTAFSAKAGPVEYEVQNSANLLTEMLKQLKEAKDRILEQVDLAPTNTYYFDAYTARNSSAAAYYGELPYAGYLSSLAN